MGKVHVHVHTGDADSLELARGRMQELKSAVSRLPAPSINNADAMAGNLRFISALLAALIKDMDNV